MPASHPSSSRSARRAAFRGVVDLLSDEAVIYENGDGRGARGPVPDDMATEEHAVHDALVEGIVVADDDLMERYLADEQIEVAELEQALAQGIARRKRLSRAVRQRGQGRRASTVSRTSSPKKARHLTATGRRRRSCSRRSSTRTSGA